MLTFFVAVSTVLWGLGFLAQWSNYKQGKHSAGPGDVILLAGMFVWGCFSLVAGCPG